MAASRTLQIYGTGSATGNAIAQVTIPTATTLLGIMVAARFDTVTDNAYVALELSKVPTSQIAVNGAQDPFLQVDFYADFVTSGLANGSANAFYPLRVSCRQGEIIYLHALVLNSSYFFTGILWF